MNFLAKSKNLKSIFLRIVWERHPTGFLGTKSKNNPLGTAQLELENSLVPPVLDFGSIIRVNKGSHLLEIFMVPLNFRIFGIDGPVAGIDSFAAAILK